MQDPLGPKGGPPNYGATAPRATQDENIPVAQAVVMPLMQANDEVQGEIKVKGQKNDDEQQQQQKMASRGSNSSQPSAVFLGLIPFLLFIFVVVAFILATEHDSSSPVTQPPQHNYHMEVPDPWPSTAPPIPPAETPPPPPPPPPEENNSRSGSGIDHNNDNKVIASLYMPRQGALMDLIHIVDDDSATLIVNEIHSVQQEVPGCEIQVLIVNDIAPGYPNPKSFATALFNNWALGSAETNNGVLVLFMMDIRRIEVAVGASLDPYMNGAWTTR